MTLESVDRREMILRRLNEARTSHVVDNPNVALRLDDDNRTSGLLEGNLRPSEMSSAETTIEVAWNQFHVRYPPPNSLDANKIVIIEVMASGLTVEYILNNLPASWHGSSKAARLEKKLRSLAKFRGPADGNDEMPQHTSHYRRQAAGRRATGESSNLPKGTKTFVEYAAVRSLVRQGFVEVVS